MGALGSDIGGRLREERVLAKLSQEKAAEFAGVARRTYLDWEKGVATPSASALGALADAGFDVLYVVTGRQSVQRDGGDKVAERHLAELEARVSSGEFLTSEHLSELTGIATSPGLSDRTRAFADRVLRYAGDASAESRQREREVRREAALRRARIRVSDACSRLGWSPPTSTEGTLVRLAVDTNVADDLLESLVAEMRRLASDGGS